MVAILGPNGAGKTTTLLTLAGALPPVSGTVHMFGQRETRPLHRRVRAGLGFVPEERATLMGLSVRDNLRLGAGGIERAVEVFDELSGLLERQAGLLSGGEQQMLCLGRILAAEPKLLLVDELSLGLAPLAVDRLMARLRTAVDQDGLAVVIVEQQARRALQVADRFYLLKHGDVVAAGPCAGAEAEIERSYLAGGER
jgi:branched-chain amino acid transport system ATP-binding protein